MKGGGGPRELSNVVAARSSPNSDVHSLPTAQTIGTRFYKRGEAVSEQVKVVHLTDTEGHKRTVHIDQASKGMQCSRKVLALCLAPSTGKNQEDLWQVARHGQDWLTLVHGPKARLLLSTSKRYFGRSGLSQLY